MTQNELRIGNYISDENRDQIQLDSFVDLCPNCAPFIDIDKCKPIPLTEEWLLKFGFEKKVLFGQDFIGRKIEITQYDLDHFTISINRETFNFCIEDCLTLREIEHVHQLQNLYYALTGEELTIKTK